MRFTGAFACAYVALDCCDKAIGGTPQELFAPKNIWVWWIFAFMWGVSCLQFLFRSEEAV